MSVSLLSVQYSGYPISSINALLDVDRGAPGANMTTLGLELAVHNDQVYRLHGGKLESVRAKSVIDVIDLEERSAHPHYVEVPAHLEIEAIWDSMPQSTGAGNNILGDNGRLILDQNVLEVPAVVATDALLAYYGATLIEEGDLVQFPDEAFPLFQMEVGERYIPDTLMTDAGGGFYLEYHHDAPHFHLPIRGGGYYLLARWNDDQTQLHITGFEIPDGKAIYTKKGAIHCDAALTGELIVGYTIAKDCSTVILQDKEGKKANIQFISD